MCSSDLQLRHARHAKAQCERHDERLLDVCDRIMVMSDGVLSQTTYAEAAHHALHPPRTRD